jgi:hypothetical protein
MALGTARAKVPTAVRYGIFLWMGQAGGGVRTRQETEAKAGCVCKEQKEGRGKSEEMRAALRCSALRCDGMQCAAICVQVWLTVRV